MINGAVGAGTLGCPKSGGAGGTIVVVSSDVSSYSNDCNGGNFMLVNDNVSSVDAPFDGSTILGANGAVGGAIFGDISILLFALSMFYVRYGESFVVTLNKEGFNVTVVVVALLLSRVITISGVFSVVVVVFVTGDVDV